MSTQRSRALVTGGAGFIGSHVVDRLLAQGHEVRVVDNLSTGSRANLAHVEAEVDFLEGDLCDPSVAARAVDSIDVIYHLAALPSVPRSLADPLGSHDANVNATVYLLNAAVQAKVGRIVYSSSSSVYGDTPELPKVESVEPLPRSPYAASKLASEQYVLAYARGGLIEGVALRYFNVFGPRQSPSSAYAAVIPLFMAAALRGTPATIFGDGEQTRDFTFVSNVVQANVLAGSRPAEIVSGAPVNVGAGERTTLQQLASLIREVSGRSLVCQTAASRPGDVRDSLASLERAKRLLGFEADVGLREGLRRTWEWLRSNESAAEPGTRPRVAAQLA
ncbi:MAG TPA: SDR family NAD(P)-dependent oxidoreductase [Gemmatimonadaceae bacterium]|nr:SDR family NAD(P)-dependent oxidoreductase [Gemmatimonadaceae bacterium]